MATTHAAALLLAGAVPLAAAAQPIEWPDDLVASFDDHAGYLADEGPYRELGLQGLRNTLDLAAERNLEGAALARALLELDQDRTDALAATETAVAAVLLAGATPDAVGIARGTAGMLYALADLRRSLPLHPDAGIAEIAHMTDAALQGRGMNLDDLLARMGVAPEARQRIAEMVALARAGGGEPAEWLVDAIVDRVLDLIPSGLAPVLGTPFGAAVRVAVQGNREMYQASREMIDVVADGYATGQIDHERVRALHRRILDIARGRFVADAARAAVRRFCEAMPFGDRFCAWLLRTRAEPEESDWCALTIRCDCDNTDFFPYEISRNQCLGYEREAREACREAGTYVGVGCDPITSGPAALP